MKKITLLGLTILGLASLSVQANPDFSWIGEAARAQSFCNLLSWTSKAIKVSLAHEAALNILPQIATQPFTIEQADSLVNASGVPAKYFKAYMRNALFLDTMPQFIQRCLPESPFLKIRPYIMDALASVAKPIAEVAISGIKLLSLHAQLS